MQCLQSNFKRQKIFTKFPPPFSHQIHKFTPYVLSWKILSSENTQTGPYILHAKKSYTIKLNVTITLKRASQIHTTSQTRQRPPRNERYVFKEFLFLVLTPLTYFFTVGVEVVYLHLITLRHTTQSVGLLWARDRPVAQTST
jgi:hypothetical protein